MRNRLSVDSEELQVPTTASGLQDQPECIYISLRNGKVTDSTLHNLLHDLIHKKALCIRVSLS